MNGLSIANEPLIYTGVFATPIGSTNAGLLYAQLKTFPFISPVMKRFFLQLPVHLPHLQEGQS